MGALCSSKKLSVFDFDEDDRDEFVEKHPSLSSRKSNKKSRSCSGASSPVANCRFMQHFAPGTMTKDKGFENEPHVIDDAEAVEERKELVSINSDDDVDNILSPKGSSHDPADIGGSLKEQMLECDCTGSNSESTVIVCPQYVVYASVCYLNPKLSFSCSSIKLDGPYVNGDKDSLISEWRTADFIKIESRFIKRFERVRVCLHLKSEHAKVADDARNSGIVKLKFVVSDPHWAEREEKIKLLVTRDKDRQDVGITLSESFEGVIYPKGDPDSVTICKRDLELLEPETFINDTIVDFYIKYLQNKIEPNDLHRFYFFNSFFYRKLADLAKDQPRACEGRTAFQRVCKWTRKVDLFQKDYIFIPVNFSLHWSLIVICHPGEVVNFRDEEIENTLKLPCILHMDSIKGSHKGLKNLIRRYLWEEWKERGTDPAENISSHFLNLRFISLELPQQQNTFDCGLFLLHYMERFVQQAPAHFNPLRAESSTFLDRDWFPPSEVSGKRAHIKKLVYEIAGHYFQQDPKSAFNDDCSSKFGDVNEDDTKVEFLHEAHNAEETLPRIRFDSSTSGATNVMPLTETQFSIVPSLCSSELIVTDEKENDIEFLCESHDLKEGFQGNCSSCNANTSILMAAKPLQSVPYSGEAELVFSGFSQPEDFGGSPIDGNDRPIGDIVLHKQSRMLMTPTEEGEETSDEIYCLNGDELEDCVIEDSQEDMEELDVNVYGNSPCLRKLLTARDQESSSSSVEIIAANCKQPVLDLEEVQVLKRRRLMLPETGKQVARNLSDDLQEIVL